MGTMLVFLVLAHFGISSRAFAVEPPLLPPEDPDRVVHLLIGPSWLEVPLRYLRPRSWHNPQSEITDYDATWSVFLGWPGLKDAASEQVRRCTEERIGCHEVIGVSVRWPEYIHRGWSGLLTCCTTKGTSLLRPLPRVAGAELFLQKYGNAWTLYLKGKAKNGEVLFGECRWGETPVSTATLRSPRRIEALIANVGRCHLRDFSVPGGFSATVGFDGSLFHQWKDIHAAVVELVANFANSDGHR